MSGETACSVGETSCATEGAGFSDCAERSARQCRRYFGPMPEGTPAHASARAHGNALNLSSRIGRPLVSLIP